MRYYNPYTTICHSRKCKLCHTCAYWSPVNWSSSVIGKHQIEVAKNPDTDSIYPNLVTRCKDTNDKKLKW